MCLAIAPGTQRSNNLITRGWRQVAATPLRLFLFGAIVHMLVGAGIVIYSNKTGSLLNTYALFYGFCYGVLALPVFGFLMTWIPGRYSLSPVHYGRYNSIYLIFMVSLITIEYGSLFSDSWSEAGMLLLIPGWLIALQGLWGLHSWINSGVAVYSRALLMLLGLNIAMLVIVALRQSIDLSISETTPLISILLVWPLVLLVTVFLVLKAPDSGRKISI